MNLQEQISRIKGMMGLLTEDNEEDSFVKNVKKYGEFKKGWIPSPMEGDLEISSPFEFKIYLFPDEKGYYLELHYKNDIVGYFHCFIDEDEGMMNDVTLTPKYRNMGLGKILLIKAMDIGYSYLGGFSADSRGITGEQERVYISLVKNGIINSDYKINYEKAQEMINNIVDNFSEN